MPFLNGNAQTQRTGQLPSTPAPKTATPAAQTPTAQTPQHPQAPAGQTPAQPAAVPQDKAQVQTQLGSSVATIDLANALPPEPPAILKLNDKSGAVTQLNRLLKNLGLVKKAQSDTYNDVTTSAIKEFQRDNNLQVTGNVDEKTLRKLIDAAKEDDNVYSRLEALLPKKTTPNTTPRPNNPVQTTPRPTAPTTPATPPVQPSTTPATPPVQPATTPVTPPAPVAETPAPVAPVAPKVYANDFERVQDLVATQLSEKGIDTEKAFGVGRELTGAAEKWDRRMPSSTMCYTAVKRAIDDSMNIPYKVFGGKQFPGGGSAKTAGTYLLSKSPEFVKIEGLKRTDLDNLPSGAVIVYKPGKGHGHIGVQNGRGNDISDKSRTQSNVHRSAAFEVYFPVDVRDK